MAAAPDDLLLTARTLDLLREYTKLPDGGLHDRLSRPYSTSASMPALSRHRAILRTPDALPPMRHAPAPSEELRGHTVSEALRVFPEVRPHRLTFGPPNRLEFSSEASFSHLSRTSEALQSSYVSRKSPYPSSSALLSASNSSSLPRSSSGFRAPRRGRASMITGGAPLWRSSQASLKALQLKQLESFS